MTDTHTPITRPPTEIEKALVMALDEFADIFATLIVERVAKKLNLEDYVEEEIKNVETVSPELPEDWSVEEVKEENTNATP